MSVFSSFLVLFFFNAKATTEIYTPLYTLSLHDALPISTASHRGCTRGSTRSTRRWATSRSEEHTSELQSHSGISYAVFCVKKKKNKGCLVKTSPSAIGPRAGQEINVICQTHPPQLLVHIFVSRPVSIFFF